LTGKWAPESKDGVVKPEVEMGSGGSKTSEGKTKAGGDGTVQVFEKELGSHKEEATTEAKDSITKGCEPEGAEWKLSGGLKGGGEIEQHGAEQKSAVSAGAYVTLTGKFKNGVTLSAGLLVGPKREDGKFEFNKVVSGNGDITLPAYQGPVHDLGGGKSWQIGATGKASVTITPNWTEIFEWLMEKTATETAPEAVGALLTGPALFAIPLTMVAGLYMTARELAEMDDLAKEADTGADAYANGVMSALGISGGGSQKNPYFGSGMGKAQGAMVSLVAKAMAIPSVVAANLTSSDVYKAIVDKVKADEKTFRSAIKAQAHETIGTELVRKHHEQTKNNFFHTDGDDQDIAHRMGLDGGHDVKFDD
jgi:hypothetical protein